MVSLSQKIKEEARRIGFDLAGISLALKHPDFALFENWLQKGFAATMDYLKKGREKRGDPHKILEGAKTVVSVGLVYYQGLPLSVESVEEGRGWISNYAWGKDYHLVLEERLQKLEQAILKLAPQAKLKSYVDTGAVLERSYAASGGLGWIGKNTCLINRKKGSLFFIGEILTGLDLEPDRPAPDHCGTCTRCLDACPTQALTPYELDASRCISYLTIEHRGKIDPELEVKMGHQIAGCDICQDVCPWNKKIPLSTEPLFNPRPENFHPTLKSLEPMTREDFSSRFKKSAVKRVKWEGLMRNVESAKKNKSVRPA